MSTDDEYYKTLGLSKNATSEQIKKAYKRCALKWHPDRNPDNQEKATENFKAISEAYDVLSNPETRSVYDKHGKKGLQENGGAQRGGMSQSNMHNIFEHMFGFNFHPQSHPSSRQAQSRGPKRGDNILFEMSVDLKDIYTGCQKKLKVTRNVICGVCRGSGCHGDSVLVDTGCPDCKGTGVKITIRQLGPGFMTQQQSICGKCEGNGTYIPEPDQCKQCKGKKVVKEGTILQVNVQKGMKSGSKVTFEKKSDEYPGTIPGDIVIVIKERNNTHFRRLGNDLMIQKQITLKDALCGLEFIIEQLDGRRILVNTEKCGIIKPNQTKAIREEGMPIRRNEELIGQGTLIVHFDVVFPDKKLSAKEKKQLNTILLNNSGQNTQPEQSDQPEKFDKKVELQ